MNSKGQLIFVTLMIAATVIILALAMAPAIKQSSEVSMSPSSDTNVGLDCSNQSISDYDKANCVMVDLALPYFFWGLLGLAAIIIGAKVILQ